MFLYEITNGWVGESYVRVFITLKTEDDEAAKKIAFEAFFKKDEEQDPETVEIVAKTFLIDGFCSLPSDCGLELYE